jgi:hypothetical protein
MIYLFDDNENQQMSKNYTVDFIEELKKYSAVITHVDSYEKIANINDVINDAKLVCIHDSFPTTDDKARIVAMSLERNIPLVIFSGGADFTITKFDDKNKNYIKTIKKDRFYFYILQLINEFITNNEINLNILAFGSNYEKVRINIINDRLGKNLFQFKNNYSYFQFFESGNQNYKDLCEVFCFSFGEKNFESDFVDFEENLEHKTIKEVYKIINTLVKQANKKYGE